MRRKTQGKAPCLARFCNEADRPQNHAPSGSDQNGRFPHQTPCVCFSTRCEVLASKSSRCGSERAWRESGSASPTPPSPRWAREGDFIWPRALRSRANMTVCWDSRAGSAARFLHSGFEFCMGICLLPFSPLPVGLGRGAEPKTDQGERLFERSEFELAPVFGEHRRLPRSAAQGTQTIGSPFFWVLFFGDAKKSASPAGARPGLLADPTARVIQHVDPGSGPG